MATRELFPIQSAYVSQFYANQNFAQPPNLFFGRFHGIGDIYRSLLQFSLDSTTFRRRIFSASLNLTISRNEIPVGVVVNAGLQYALQPWPEFSVTWSNQPGFNPVNTFALSSNNTPGSIISIDVTAIVKDWAKGLVPNHGFVITGNETLDSLVGVANHPVVPRPIRRRHSDCDDVIPVFAQHIKLDDGISFWKDVDCHHHHRHHHHHHRDTDEGCNPRPGLHDVVGTSIAIEDPPGSLNFVVQHNVVNAGPRLIISFD